MPPLDKTKIKSKYCSKTGEALKFCLKCFKLKFLFHFSSFQIVFHRFSFKKS